MIATTNDEGGRNRGIRGGEGREHNRPDRRLVWEFWRADVEGRGAIYDLLKREGAGGAGREEMWRGDGGGGRARREEERQRT